jgi:hypothetical protein
MDYEALTFRLLERGSINRHSMWGSVQWIQPEQETPSLELSWLPLLKDSRLRSLLVGLHVSQLRSSPDNIRELRTTPNDSSLRPSASDKSP